MLGHISLMTICTRPSSDFNHPNREQLEREGRWADGSPFERDDGGKSETE
jgi:hypothetical protein